MNARLKDWLADTHHRVFGCRGAYADLARTTARVETASLSSATCHRLIQALDAALADPDAVGTVHWSDPQGADRRVFGFEHFFPAAVTDLGIGDELARISGYLGSAVRSWTLLASRIAAVPGNLGSGGGWHRDSAFRHQVKVIWYLNDVSLENGPFSYVAGTHYRRRTSAPGDSAYETRLEVNPEEATSVTAPAGTKLVCDTKCVHGGRVVESGVRYAITLYTFESQAQMDLLLRKLKKG